MLPGYEAYLIPLINPNLKKLLKRVSHLLFFQAGSMRAWKKIVSVNHVCKGNELNFVWLKHTWSISRYRNLNRLKKTVEQLDSLWMIHYINGVLPGQAWKIPEMNLPGFLATPSRFSTKLFFVIRIFLQNNFTYLSFKYCWILGARGSKWSKTSGHLIPMALKFSKNILLFCRLPLQPLMKPARNMSSRNVNTSTNKIFSLF